MQPYIVSHVYGHNTDSTTNRIPSSRKLVTAMIHLKEDTLRVTKHAKIIMSQIFFVQLAHRVVYSSYLLLSNVNEPVYSFWSEL